MSRRKQRAIRRPPEPAPATPAAEEPSPSPLPLADADGGPDPGPAIVQWMLGGYLVLAALAIAVFRGSGASGAMAAGSEMSGDRAVFWCCQGRRPPVALVSEEWDEGSGDRRDHAKRDVDD